MTTAVCFRCGELKFGAFCPCQCGAMPQTEDELAISLAMTDHYFDDTKRYIDAIDLSETQRQQVFEGNALRVFPRLRATIERRGG